MMFMKKNGGFTLVELIVVIAILAILAGVAVPAYSGYVEKANMQADISLVREVENALTLAYYSNPDGFKSGKVVLSLNGAPDCGGNDVFEAALTATFGEGWKTREDMRLKYNNWSGGFQSSSFFDKETGKGMEGLLGTVETLTGALGGFLQDESVSNLLDGDSGFTQYVNGMGANGKPQKVADAAVFYVADVTGKLDPQALQNAGNIVITNSDKKPDEVLGLMNGQLNSSLASAAALYAMAEGYANFYDANYEAVDGKTPRGELDKALVDIKNSADSGDYNGDSVKAFTGLLTAFQNMAAVGHQDALNAYLNNEKGMSPLQQDLNAYADAMKTVAASKDSIVQGNKDADLELGDDGYFTSSTVTGMFEAYAQGGIFVHAIKSGDGIVVDSNIG